MTTPTTAPGGVPQFITGQEYTAAAQATAQPSFSVGIGYETRDVPTGQSYYDEDRRRKVQRTSPVEGLISGDLQEQQDGLFIMPEEELRDLQDKLWRAGLYGGMPRERIPFGVVTEETYDAFGKLLELTHGYNSAGRTIAWYDLLDRLALDEEAMGGRAPLTVRLPSPEDTAAVAREVARETLGHKLTDEEIEQFVTGYQQRNREFQEASYAAGPEGGTVVEPPSPGVAAEEFVRSARPVEAGGKDVQKAVDGVMNFILNGVN